MADAQSSIEDRFGRAIGLEQAGRPQEAMAEYRALLREHPGLIEGHINLGTLLQARGDLDGARASFEAAMQIDPLFAEAHNGLGHLHLLAGDSAAAAVSFMTGAAVRPDWAPAWNNLGSTLRRLGMLEQAGIILRRALTVSGDFVDGLLNLGNVMTSLSRIDEAAQFYQRILDIQPDHAGAISNLLFALNYSDTIEAGELARRYKELGARLEAAAPLLASRTRAPIDGRRIRIGYVSPDFRAHAVAYFFEPFLRHHDRTRFETFCYAELSAPDAVSQRLEALSDHWIPTLGLSDQALAERVAADGIDILVDLAGHSAHHRLGVFARRPAPVQATWLGYPNTTGLSRIDYRLVDAVTDPAPQADALASEKLMRLEGGFHCYQPPADAPPVGPPPHQAKSHVTFGSFNNISKLSDSTLVVWAGLLQRVPDARLVIKSRFFSEPISRERFNQRLSAAGLDLARVELAAGIAEVSDHLAAYNAIDISLDSFPYNGTTTLCESFWMGVPAVALRGDRHLARVGASLLTHVGLGELVADTPQEYIEIAAALAEDRPRLAALRAGLRERVAASPIGDAPGFARKMERAFEEMLAETREIPQRRIIVDGVFFQLYQTGIARVWAELLRRWSAGALGKRIVLLDRGGLPEDLPGLVETIATPPFDYADWEGEAARLQRLCDEQDAELFLSTYFTRPAKTPSLLLLYDMIPERLGVDLTSPMWLQKHESIRHAAAIACISQSTLADLHEFFPESAHKPALVAHMGISPAFRPPSPAERAEFHDIFVEPQLGGRRYLLFVGDPEGYKNGRLLVDALSKIDCMDLAVLLTRGQEGGVIAALREIPGLIVHVQHLSEMGLQLAYGSALGLVFPSYYEGFGMPVIEAMACGCPVICSGTSSMPEVAGDAALLINPTSADDLAAAIGHLGNSDIRQALVERGLKRATSFSWDRCADTLENFIMDQLGETAPSMPCRLCDGPTQPWGRKTLLGRLDVAYGVCDNCGSLQTEAPYWLDEAYAGHTTGLDTGACQRCFDLVLETTTLLDWLGFPKESRCVDFGSGTGLYGRMMRDRGYDFHAQDRYVKPYYMDGFSVEAVTPGHFRLITAFEVVEHFPNPAQDLASLFGADADLVMISTNPYTGQDQTWSYLSPESGQHIFFYSLKALASIAAAYGYQIAMGRQSFLFAKNAYEAALKERGIDFSAIAERLRDNNAYSSQAWSLLTAHQRDPYRQAALDNQALAHAKGKTE